MIETTMFPISEDLADLEVIAVLMIPAWLMFLLSFWLRKVRWPLRIPAVTGIVGYLAGYEIGRAHV